MLRLRSTLLLLRRHLGTGTARKRPVAGGEAGSALGRASAGSGAGSDLAEEKRGDREAS
jgi:hypothetical protein